MYLSIPSGMHYKQVTEDSITADYFVDPTGERPAINIQEKIKDALQNNQGRKKEIQLDEFSIYLRSAPFNSKMYLRYTPNRNGALPTIHATEIVQGYDGRKSSVTTTYGTLWFHKTPLDAKRLQEVLDARDEQRENRRHTGDSPCAT